MFVIKGYNLLDLRAGLESNEGKWRVQVWGRNITNELYDNNISHLTDAVTAASGMPATYGVSLSLRD